MKIVAGPKAKEEAKYTEDLYGPDDEIKSLANVAEWLLLQSQLELENGIRRSTLKALWFLVREHTVFAYALLRYRKPLQVFVFGTVFTTVVVTNSDHTIYIEIEIPNN